jgi:hypothetical protein
MVAKPKRESLVDWVTKNAPQPPVVVGTSRAVRAAAAPAHAPRYLTLRDWAASLFGENTPHANTLLRWVHEGRIQPQPKKMGRRWWVTPTAEYVED